MQNRIPPPLLALLAAIAMWALDHWWPATALVPAAYARVGLLPAAMGVAIVLTAMRLFRRAGTTISPLSPQNSSHLVTTGLFSRSRNPMYVGLTCVLVGYAIGLGTASPWLMPPVFLAAITWLQIFPEERALRRLFGVEYDAYCRKVRRWL
ncbi:MAG: isoprenylcysteine carboxylmethyltransferase family protein [Pseudomonadota bacterium]